ncbi:MAG TPA: FAD-binding oxidoreductase [Actinomycetota bacterium]|nr:FAD-binding oxidoreductase [Actinomycetota bacterium]
MSKRAETPHAATLVFEPATPGAEPAPATGAEAAAEAAAGTEPAGRGSRVWRRRLAGQHVDVRLTADDGYQAERSYSIASAPEDPALELTVERLDEGEVSLYLVDDMLPGDLLELRGPIGGWFVWDVRNGGPLLLIAGGSGLVPLMAMLRHRQRQHSTVPARLLVSVRTAEDLFYAAELADLAAAADGFELFVTVTRGDPIPGSPLRGRINQAMLAAVAWPAAERPRAYVCGPTPFVETATGLLVELGYPPEAVRAERFGPSGTIDPVPAG